MILIITIIMIMVVTLITITVVIIMNINREINIGDIIKLMLQRVTRDDILVRDYPIGTWASLCHKGHNFDFSFASLAKTF